MSMDIRARINRIDGGLVTTQRPQAAYPMSAISASMPGTMNNSVTSTPGTMPNVLGTVTQGMVSAEVVSQGGQMVYKQAANADPAGPPPSRLPQQISSAMRRSPSQMSRASNQATPVNIVSSAQSSPPAGPVRVIPPSPQSESPLAVSRFPQAATQAMASSEAFKQWLAAEKKAELIDDAEADSDPRMPANAGTRAKAADGMPSEADIDAMRRVLATVTREREQAGSLLGEVQSMEDGLTKANGKSSDDLKLPQEEDLGSGGSLTLPAHRNPQNEKELRRRLAYAEVRRELAETEVEALKNKADTPRRAAHRAVQKTISIQEASFRKGRDELQQEIESVDSLRREAETKAAVTEHECETLKKQLEEQITQTMQLEAHVKKLEMHISQLTEKAEGCEARIALHVRRIASEEARRQHLEAQLEVEVTRRRKLETEALTFEQERSSMLAKVAEAQAVAREAVAETERMQEKAKQMAEAEDAARGAKADADRRDQIEAQIAEMNKERQALQIEKEQVALRERCEAAEMQATVAERKAEEESKRRQNLEKEVTMYMKSVEEKDDQGQTAQKLREKLAAAEQLISFYQDREVQRRSDEIERGQNLLDRLPAAEAEVQRLAAEKALDMQVSAGMRPPSKSPQPGNRRLPGEQPVDFKDRIKNPGRPSTASSRASSMTSKSMKSAADWQADTSGINATLRQGLVNPQDDLSKQLATAEQALTVQATRYNSEVEELTRRLAQVQLAESVQAKSHARDCEDLLQRLAVVDTRAEEQAAELQASGLLTARPGSSKAGSDIGVRPSMPQLSWQMSGLNEDADRLSSLPPHLSDSPSRKRFQGTFTPGGLSAGRDPHSMQTSNAGSEAGDKATSSRAASMADWSRTASPRERAPVVDLRAFAGADISGNSPMVDRFDMPSSPMSEAGRGERANLSFSQGNRRGSSPTHSQSSAPPHQRSPTFKTRGHGDRRVGGGQQSSIPSTSSSLASFPQGQRGQSSRTLPPPTSPSSHYLLPAKNR